MKLKIEPVEFKHLKWLREQRNKKEVMDFFREPFMLNEVNQEDWLKAVSRDRSVVPFIITDLSLPDGQNWIGYGAYSNIDWVARRGELSYFTASEHSAKGYAPVSVAILIEYGFRRLGFQKINTETFLINPKEIELLKTLGFKEEGKLSRHYFKRGALQDALSLAIFSEDVPYDPKLLKDSESKSL